jgi:hypothetical protein
MVRIPITRPSRGVPTNSQEQAYSPQECVEQVFCEVRPAFWGHMVSLISTMMKTAPAQMATRQTHNAAT